MSSRAKFAVGDVAIVTLPDGDAPVRVIEDRGPLGVGGRRILRVEVLIYDGWGSFEVPEDLLRPVTPARDERSSESGPLRQAS